MSMPQYKPAMSGYTREMEQFQAFLGTVMSVNCERMVCTVEDLRTKYVYREVGAIPCAHSSYESTDVQMPETGSTCLCIPLYYAGGHEQIAILAWAVSHTPRAIDCIARKDFETILNLNERKRGNYRKAWPGQRAASMVGGYTERRGTGWDRSSQGFDRENVDAPSRTWTQVTSRRVGYSDLGLVFEGPSVRPDAPPETVVPTVMPDGSRECVEYLQPASQPSDRYVKGEPDVVAYSERVECIQEFALDYPLPPETLQTDLLDHALGTTESPWASTSVAKQGNFQVDSQTYFADQAFDHPTDSRGVPLGPTLNEGTTPRRKGFIIERSEGTLVGYSRFDRGNYGYVLKPVLSDPARLGRFGADFQSGYSPVKDSKWHAEARLAAACYSTRFPSEYNTTRWDVSKEGMLTFEIGSTLPNGSLKAQVPGEAYEHPHGAGRSVEGHLVGSLKLVVGKNRDEEDAIDLQALGQTVLRLGCDDASLPDSGRSVQTQIRGSGDKVQPRTLQYWASSKAGPGDPGDLENKTGMESVSLRMAADGAVVVRLGSRNSNALRRHLMNGYDAKGQQQGGKNSHSSGRPAYGAGDITYRFHDLSVAGVPRVGRVPYNDWMGNPVGGGMDAHGLSLDLHAVRDVLLRIGSNPSSGQSLLLDLAGGIVVAAGKDSQGRSLTGALDGGVELTIGQSNSKKGLRLEINGDIDLMVKGNYHTHCTGDVIFECTNFRQITKCDHVLTAQNINETALAIHLSQAPQILNNSGTTPDQAGGYS